MSTAVCRTFTAADQERFAEMSGDYNPVHVDAGQARRTQAGAQVVHGLHLLLWSLDALAGSGRAVRRISRLRAQFLKFVYLDEVIELSVHDCGEHEIEVQLAADGIVRSIVGLSFGEPSVCPDRGPTGPVIAPPRRGQALALDIAEMDGRSGAFALAPGLNLARGLFPALCDWITAERVAALAATTCLVGMVVPGLHSVFSGLSVGFCDDGSSPLLAFRVESVHARFRTVDHRVWGGGIEGKLTTLVRRPPTPQLSYAEVGPLVDPREFAGSTALIVGGSRGLGELTAKIVAAGGGTAIISYHVGEADAQTVAEEIRSGGGDCAVVRYDASLPPPPAITDLAGAITHAYYFATGGISRPQARTYSRERLDTFMRLYIDGFFYLCEALAATGGAKTIFYPSTVFVTSRPRGMTEYVMAKAAGEILAADIAATMPTLDVVSDRLPRVLTDQTASIVPVSTSSSIDVLVPIMRKLHRRRGASSGPIDP